MTADRSADGVARHLRSAWPTVVAAVALTTLFGLLYTLRMGLSVLETGSAFNWEREFLKVIANWWASLLFVPPLFRLVQVAPLARHHWFRNGLLLLAGATAASVVRSLLDAPLAMLLGESVPPLIRATRVVAALGAFLAIIGMLHAAFYYRAMHAREQEALRLAESLARAELAASEARLSALRSQLHPHFLFNTINAIAALMHHEPWRADRMLTQLAELLRNMLRAPVVATHSLREELLVLGQYLDLMTIRFGERLTVHRRVDENLLDVRVPWLVLQPVVENALEHGIWPRSQPGTLVIEARRAGNAMELVVDDDGVGVNAADSRRGEATGSGLGLSNTRLRLEHLYGGRASLSVGSRAGGGTRVVITVPIAA